MVMGKLGAFLNKDLGAIAKDAGKMLNTDLGTIAKGAGRVLKSDLGDLLRDTPQSGQPAEEVATANQAVVAPAPKEATAISPVATPSFDPEATQKMTRMPAAAPPATQVTATQSRAAPAFDPDVTQKMQQTSAAPLQASPGDTNPKIIAPTPPVEPTKFNQELLFRAQRAAPVGTEVKVLLPYSVGEFERSHATPSGELTNDPVNAVYAGRGEPVLVQLALCWDDDEARQLVNERIQSVLDKRSKMLEGAIRQLLGGGEALADGHEASRLFDGVTQHALVRAMSQSPLRTT